MISNLYPPYHDGGYELSCADVMERLVGRGHEVTVLTSDRGLRHGRRMSAVPARSGDAPARSAGAGGGRGRPAVMRRLRLYWEDGRLLSPPVPARLAIERANRAALEDAMAAARPDVVSVWNMAAVSLGLLTAVAARGVPLVYVVCNDWLDWGPDMDAWMRLWRRRPAAGRAASRLTGLPTVVGDLGSSGTFCFVSDWTRRRAEDRSPWTFADSTVVYSGIDATDFPMVDESSADRPWRWRLLFVGRLDPDKGAHRAVEALGRLPEEATLRILGPGNDEQRAELWRLARSEGVEARVEIGVAERSALAAHYRSSDAFLFPSRWDEPFGLVPVEAMACGTPVVATGTGGSTEFLRHEGNCLLVPREDPGRLAEAVSALAADPGLRRKLAAGGRRTAAALTVDALADCLEEWHVGAAAGFAGGRPADRVLPL
ncbi:MAG TPA: glycosyltransferase family 4 protein [Acidimicrobiales bacterium]|nr:glycosyltransferase family 4 protein [Acidimicrobiales bacterium]